MKLENIRERKIPDYLIITSEVIRPVTEKWLDGLVRETDNLQLVIKSKNNKTIDEIDGYLYFYDTKGNELGHEYDLANKPVKPGGEERLSFMLLPPEGYSYAILEVRAEVKKANYYLVKTAIFIAALGLVYAYTYFFSA